jgi:hypothetical protein
MIDILDTFLVFVIIVSVACLQVYWRIRGKNIKKMLRHSEIGAKL